MKRLLLATLVLIGFFTVSACDATDDSIRDIVEIESLEDMFVSTFTGFEMLNLPGQLTVTLDDGSETLVRVSWESARSDYNAARPGVYVLHGQPITTGRVTNQAAVEAVITVTVSAGSLLETMENLGHYSIFIEMIETAALVDMLESANDLTVFAPTDDAFDALFTNFNLPRSMLMSLEQLNDIVLYHIHDRSREYDALLDFAPMSLPMLSGDAISFTLEGPQLVLNETATVGASNRIFTNGVLHDIDGVLIPPNLIEDLLLDLIGDDMMDMLLNLLLESGLLNLLISGASFTIFAPNETAFSNLAAELDLSLEALLELERLPDILAYHIVEGEYLLDDLFISAPTSLPTFYGDTSLSIENVDGEILVEGANIISSETFMGFGIVHTIDQILIPDDIAEILFP